MCAAQWVARVERRDDGMWRLYRDNGMRYALSATDKGPQTDYDYIVIAHNGKCAEKLMREVSVLKVS